jgi:hypothetical protein
LFPNRLQSTEFGTPFSVKGLAQRIRDWCDQAELFHSSTHGLRKAGTTEKELTAVFMWTTKNQAANKTAKARLAKIAAGAMQQLIPEQK